MRKEVKNILKVLIEFRKTAIVDNDFEKVYNIIDIKAEHTDLVETIYLLESILNENRIDISEIYGDDLQ